MSKRPVILVDMDGVLADFDGATEQFLLQKHPDVEVIRNREHFYYKSSYSSLAHQAIISELHASQDFFRLLPVIDGALEGWQQIIDLGYEPRICSSPLSSNQWCREEKLLWVEQHLGKHARDTAIITKNKERHDGIALIDDRPEIAGAETAQWRHILFSQSYNSHIDTDFRIHDWHDTNLERLLAACVAPHNL